MEEYREQAETKQHEEDNKNEMAYGLYDSEGETEHRIYRIHTNKDIRYMIKRIKARTTFEWLVVGDRDKRMLTAFKIIFLMSTSATVQFTFNVTSRVSIMLWQESKYMVLLYVIRKERGKRSLRNWDVF